jgi:pre-mRNA-splicing helicase BRR2
MNRTPLSTDLAADQKFVLEHIVRLISGLVDVISSNSWLQPALMEMELSQMAVQATTPNHSPLTQIPHFDAARIEKAKGLGVADVFDLINMEDDDRDELLKGLSKSEIADVAKACNRYPVITMEYEVEDKDQIEAGKPVAVKVNLDRDTQDEALGPVYAPYYPKEKDEQWWVVMGGGRKAGSDETMSQLLAIKRLSVNKQTANVKLEFDAPEEPGKYEYVLYLMSDCYLGCDQEYKFELTVH